RIVACAVENHALHVWEAMSGRLLSLEGGHSLAPGAIAFTADGRTVLTAADTGLIAWDAVTGKQREWKRLPGKIVPWDFVDSAGGPPFAISPGGKYLALHEDKCLSLRDVASGREVRRFQDHGMSNARLAFSRDGGVVAMAGQNEGPWAWDIG